jgi:Protein of unknown function (DUF4197)
MNRRNLIAALLLSGLARPAWAKASSADAAAGIKEALGRATDSVIDRLGKDGGFWTDKVVQIALPGPLKKASKILKYTDKAGLTGGLQRSLNTAAEKATPLAKPLLKKAIGSMSLTDGLGIVTGGSTAATEYLRTSVGADIEKQMRPIVAGQLKGIKAYDQLNKLVGKAGLPIKGLSEDDLTDYVTGKTADGIFHYMGVEEAAIRANPAKTGSKLLKSVFGL